MARHIAPSKGAWQKRRLPRLQFHAVGMASMRQHDAGCKTQDVRRRTQASSSTLLLTTRRHCQSHPCPATSSCRLTATCPAAESSAACSRVPGPPAARSFSVANHPPNCCCPKRSRSKTVVASRHSSLPGTTSSRLPGPPAESSACLVHGTPSSRLPGPPAESSAGLVYGATNSRVPGPPAQTSGCCRFPGPPAESPISPPWHWPS